MDLSETGMQPFERDGNALVCNGEIYGFRKIKKELEKKYRFCGDSDCEILLPMYEEYGLEMFRMLDAEFALILFDGKRKKYIAARDPVGIRRSSTAIRNQERFCLPARRKTSLASRNGSCPFRPGIIMSTENFTATTILQTFRPSVTIRSKRSAGTSGKS